MNTEQLPDDFTALSEIAVRPRKTMAVSELTAPRAAWAKIREIYNLGQLVIELGLNETKLKTIAKFKTQGYSE